jgi:hypothetical protein
VTNKSSLCVGAAAVGDFELLQVSISDLESMQDAKMEITINGQCLADVMHGALIVVVFFI